MFENLLRTQSRNALAGPEDWVLGLEDQVEDYYNSEDFDDEDEAVTCGQLTTDAYCALKAAIPLTEIPNSAKIVTRVTCGGVVYTTRTVHEGNSGVLLYGSDTPFAIDHIIEFPNNRHLERYWLIVKQYSAGEVAMDLYSAYPHARARLWSAEMERGVKAIPFSEVETHFAKCAVT